MYPNNACTNPYSHFSGLVDDCPLPEGQSSSSLLQAFGEVDQIGDKGEGVDWKPFSGEETFFSLVALGSRSLLQVNFHN